MLLIIFNLWIVILCLYSVVPFILLFEQHWMFDMRLIFYEQSLLLKSTQVYSIQTFIIYVEGYKIYIYFYWYR